nr:hypothetical protein [Comamonas testosteroni]
MRHLLALTLALCTAPAIAQSALDQDLLGQFEPLSRTAIAITGSIQITPSSIIFVGKSVKTEKQGKYWRVWGSGTRKHSAIVYALKSDPGQLLQGNTLCGLEQARFAAIWPSYDEFSGRSVEVAVYSSEIPPVDGSSPGLCGTFSYVLK